MGNARLSDSEPNNTIERWSDRQDSHLRPPGPKPGALKTELHSEKIGAPGGTCTHTLPADNGLLFFSATGAFEMQNAQCTMQSAEHHQGFEMQNEETPTLPAPAFDSALCIPHATLGVGGVR